MTYLKAFAAAAVVFLLVDIAWIGLFLGDVYDRQLGSMMRAEPAVSGAVLFYVGYLLGILYFAVRPALVSDRLSTAAANGALLGVLSYGTYTLTNYAIFAAWSPLLVVSDIAWGAFLTAVSGAAGYLAARK